MTVATEEIEKGASPQELNRRIFSFGEDGVQEKVDRSQVSVSFCPSSGFSSSARPALTHPLHGPWLAGEGEAPCRQTAVALGAPLKGVRVCVYMS